MHLLRILEQLVTYHFHEWKPLCTPNMATSSMKKTVVRSFQDDKPNVCGDYLHWHRIYHTPDMDDLHFVVWLMERQIERDKIIFHFFTGSLYYNFKLVVVGHILFGFLRNQSNHRLFVSLCIRQRQLYYLLLCALHKSIPYKLYLLGTYLPYFGTNNLRSNFTLNFFHVISELFFPPEK